ncbi:MAG: PQQ-binding-like beta-propeller repeat protein [Actinomycetota bacterium]|nr:PQQ-binding-like beta-propeller repeat protein [Actinomycetota bacterium]
MRRKILFALAAGGLLLAGLALAAYVRITDKPSTGLDTDLVGVSVSTAEEEAAELTTTSARDAEGRKKQVGERCWPTYGGNPQRTLAVPDINLGNPKRAVWARGMRDLIELPPAFCDGRLYVNLERGRSVALDARSGRKVWTWRAGGKLVSSPAIAGPRLIVASTDGVVTALRRANGRPLWSVRTNGAVESSPVVIDETAYFGSLDGRLFAVDVRTGRVRWAYDTGSEIKGAASVWGDRICVANYGGAITCLRRTNGRKLWTTYVKRDALRYESFYATPSTDGARIYTAARTGKVVALSGASGHTVWTENMGALAYATPAIAHGRIFLGAFDGFLRSYRASDGTLLWSRSVAGKIIAPALVVGNLVFVSTLEGRTFGLRVGDGKIVWRIRAGAYAPGIATNRRYYFSLNGLLLAFRGERGPR